MSLQEAARLRHRNVLIYVVMAICVMYAGAIAFASEVSDALSLAERADKLSGMGVLAFGFLISLSTLAFLIRLQYGKMLLVIEQNTQAVVKVTDAIEHCKMAR